MDASSRIKLDIKLPAARVIACATVMEEIQPLMSPGMNGEILDFGLHVDPASLKISLQKAINNVPAGTREIILGYGLCSQAVVGLKSESCTMIVPRVDDCIAVFLGSKASYIAEHYKAPGTYYLTKGWIKTATTPFDDYDRIVVKYGERTARRIMQQMLKNYTRLAFINTGTGLEEYHALAQATAKRFGLTYEEISGDNRLIKKLLFGPRDDELLVVQPGRAITFDDFMRPSD
jgi:hypothetical protein